MEEQDLVFYKNKDGNIMSGGYLIKSMNNNLTQMVNSNEKHKDTTDNQRGGGLNEILQNLAVPAGLLYLQQTFNIDNNLYENENDNSNTKLTNTETYKKSNKVVEPSLYEKLVHMVSNNKKNRKNKTRKNNNRKKQNKTKKT